MVQQASSYATCLNQNPQRIEAKQTRKDNTTFKHFHVTPLLASTPPTCSTLTHSWTVNQKDNKQQLAIFFWKVTVACQFQLLMLRDFQSSNDIRKNAFYRHFHASISKGRRIYVRGSMPGIRWKMDIRMPSPGIILSSCPNSVNQTLNAIPTSQVTRANKNYKWILTNSSPKWLDFSLEKVLHKKQLNEENWSKFHSLPNPSDS